MGTQQAGRDEGSSGGQDKGRDRWGPEPAGQYRATQHNGSMQAKWSSLASTRTFLHRSLAPLLPAAAAPAAALAPLLPPPYPHLADCLPRRLPALAALCPVIRRGDEARLCRRLPQLVSHASWRPQIPGNGGAKRAQRLGHLAAARGSLRGGGFVAVGCCCCCWWWWLDRCGWWD